MPKEDNYWERLQAGRLSRRSVLRGAAFGAAGLAAASVVGCGDDDDGADSSGSPAAKSALPEGFTEPPVYSASHPEARQLLIDHHWSKLPDRVKAERPQRGGRTVIPHLSPHAAWDPAKFAQPGLVISLGLTHNNVLSQDYGPRAKDLNNPLATTRDGLAESFEQPDATTMVFKLRKGVKFHNLPPVNGRELKAEDVVYSWNTYKSGGPYAATYRAMEQIEATAPDTVRVKLAQPAAYLVTQLALTGSPIFAREQHETPNGLDRPIGTGPYILEEWEYPRIERYRRNPDYFVQGDDGKPLPYLDAVEFPSFPDPAAAEAAWRSGQIDYFRPATATQLRGLLGDNAVPQVALGSPQTSWRLAFNHRNPLFKDARVRQAISLAVNRQNIFDTVLLGAGSPRGAVPYNYLGEQWDPTLSAMGTWHSKHDPQQARRLLQEAGQSNLELELLIPRPAGVLPHHQLIQQDLAQVGVKLNFSVKDVAAFVGDWYTGKWKDLADWAVLTTDFDPDAFTYQILHSKGPLNTTGVSDPEIERLAELQRTQLDAAERRKTLRRIWELELAAPYTAWIGIGFGMSVHKKYLRDVADQQYYWVNGGGATQLARAWFDSNAPKR